MNGSILQRQPREITLTAEGERIHPRDLFRGIYGQLEELVNLNKPTPRTLSSSIGRHTRSTTSPVNEHNLTAAFTRWLNDIPPYEASITFDDGSVSTYAVQPRTNFDVHSMRKTPNIVQLRHQDGTVAILREARTHPLDDLIAPFVRSKLSDKFDIEATRQFYHGAEAALVPATERKAMYIPEPHLLAALEKLYTARAIPRLTPELALVDSSPSELWYLRDFLPRMEDLGVDRQGIGVFAGTLHQLGLMEFLDRQSVHYAITPQGVVTYDPDFFLHSRNRSLVRNRDGDDLRSVFSSTADPQTEKPLPALNSHYKRAYNTQRRALEAKGIGSTTLFTHLSSRPDSTVFNAQVTLQL